MLYAFMPYANMPYAVMRVISLATQKGGSGKSTLAINLAVAASQAGETVIAIDCDEQGTLSAWAETRAAGSVPTVAALPRASLLPDLLAEAATRFSLAILDTPGRDNALTHAAVTAAHIALIPIRPTRADAHGIRPTFELCVRANRHFAFVLNQCATTIFSPRAHEMAAGLETLGVLAKPMIGLRVDYQDAYASGTGVTERAPDSKAAAEIRALWDWVNQQVRNDETTKHT
jgi:chromosome partitioning protein